MRKYLVLLAIVAIAGVAWANSLIVPFFLDNSVQALGFIGIANTSSDALEIGLIYNDAIQDDEEDPETLFRTPAENTFELGGNTAIGWRPATNDPGVEAAGADVPNMTGFRDLDGDSTSFAGPLGGSCTIYWEDGEATDIKGRYVEIRPAAGSAFAYFLGEGRENP